MASTAGLTAGMTRYDAPNAMETPDPAAHSGMSDAFMRAAVEEASRGRLEGGIPIGSVLVHDGQIIGRGHNRRRQPGSGGRQGGMGTPPKPATHPARIY